MPNDIPQLEDFQRSAKMENENTKKFTPVQILLADENFQTVMKRFQSQECDQSND